jgi:hypothetical protein
MNFPVADTHMIVLPGGGYAENAAHEAEPVANWLSEIGVQASVFRYPLNVRHPVPLDALRAEIGRRRAAGAQRIGLIGFSAGGHLAGLAALAPGATPEETVQFAVLGYAITSMETETYRPARLILLGEDASPQLRRSTSLDSLVTPVAAVFRLAHRRGPLRPSRTYLPLRLGTGGQPSSPRPARVRPRPAQPWPGSRRRRGRNLDHTGERLDPRAGVTAGMMQLVEQRDPGACARRNDCLHATLTARAELADLRSLSAEPLGWREVNIGVMRERVVATPDGSSRQVIAVERPAAVRPEPAWCASRQAATG